MKFYCIRGHANKFFTSYLTERKQFTIINGEKSDTRSIACGVPQGSVLGPILFLLYINDLCNAVGPDTTRLFADDAGLFTHGKNIKLLTEESIIIYKRLFKWCLCNRLTINYSQTCFMIFHSKRKPIPCNISEIKVNDITISRVNVTKYLGLYIDEHLTWDHHITHLCNSLTKFFGIFKKIQNSSTKELSRQLYYAFIHSRINYGIQVYGSCALRLRSKIQILSNKLLKYLLRLPQRTPTNELHKDMKILKIDDLITINILAFVKKCLFDDCPELFKSYFRYQSHNYDTRDPKLFVKRSKTQLGSNSLKIKGASLWNNIENEIKSKCHLKSFKKCLTLHFISKYRTVDN